MRPASKPLRQDSRALDDNSLARSRRRASRPRRECPRSRRQRPEAVRSHSTVGFADCTKTTLYSPRRTIELLGMASASLGSTRFGRYIHHGSQLPVGVVERATDFRRTRVRVHGPAHPIDRTCEHAAGIRNGRDLRGRADVDASHIDLVDVAQHPDLVELANRENSPHNRVGREAR